ncbi:MAG: VOC family protein [Lapillicoccus sp.]
MIFVNLPVTDLPASRDFYTALGFTVNEAFSDDQVAAIVVSETIVVMLLTRDRFADFVTGAVGDPRAGPTAIACLSAESPAEVDLLVGTALAAGGSAWLPKMEDGPMYGHSFADPDGHVWEVLHMDLGHIDGSALG